MVMGNQTLFGVLVLIRSARFGECSCLGAYVLVFITAYDDSTNHKWGIGKDSDPCYF